MIFRNSPLTRSALLLTWLIKRKERVHLLHVIEVPVMHDSLLMPTLSFEATLLKELSDNAENQFKKLIADFPTEILVQSQKMCSAIHR